MNEGSPSSSAARGQRRLLFVLGLTAIYLIAEVTAGLLTNSLALLADAGHMLTDVLGLGMALFAIRFAQRPATPAKTYGFYRAEILAALANSVLLFGVAGYIVYEASRRLQQPPEIDSLPMLVVALGGLVVNLIGAKLLHTGSRLSLNVQGAFLEVVSDLLGSLGVIVAAAIIYFTGWWLADPIISIVIGLFMATAEERAGRPAGGHARPHEPRGYRGNHARCAGGSVGARPPRLDYHQRLRCHERARAGRRPTQQRCSARRSSDAA
jgi:cobalt-zinc-cadmium efflux system protein